MKKLLILAFAISVFSCKTETKPDYILISGKITNKLPSEVSINTQDRSFSEPIDVAADGTFFDTLTVEKGAYVLYDGKNPVFLHFEPGYNLNINYDANDFQNSLVITGEGAPENNYLAEKLKKTRELMGDNASLYSLSEEEYKVKQLAIKESLLTLLNNTKGISESFKVDEEKELNYNYLGSLNIYERAHGYFTKNTDFKVSDDFLDEYEGFDYANEADYNASPSYKKIVADHYALKINDYVTKDALTQEEAFFKTARDINSETIRNTFLFDVANQTIVRAKDIEAFYKEFMEISTNEENNAIITEKYNQLTAVAKGKPSPKFVDYENYKGGTTSLDDLKGKFVYIDVWATWCGPCKREIPFLKELEKTYHDKNIEFVSLSIDKVSDREKWKKMIETENLQGVQVLADNDWKSKFVTDYQIQGIPRFILIDEAGNIVDPNAPRPSDPKLVELFTELNI
ncbi:TlpA disulfide reductase family protein [Tamlana sp. 2_MG-2023]|uniref:TlpA family protein disulfide reductase n=1 Tax=unclassified Tamlana TaxID=2614803 RepID=UPI0026E47360|nr:MULTISPECIES: TlpA disulfide reductase family protein [unclassified Tamlana]MDO6759535.1 TlpA disulfide reductase family protein [Tamlana sp. 2_MG-2023]MDO6790326.1 TlpA disulfide reductase family protein [Tamlana sp. 1_MG-2023]